MKQKNLVLMVVAVGCGLGAAVLTSQMNAKSAPVEKVRVIVAAKDLTVGTMITKEDLLASVKWKDIARDAIPQAIVETEDELIDKRLTRTIRADETISKADLTKHGVVSIPPGMNMVALPIDAKQAVAGFILPGSRVDVLASIRLQNKIRALPILVNMLILAVDTNPSMPQGGVHSTLSTVSFAVDRKQALLIKLAQARGADISLLLRNPEDKDNENDRNYKIEEVIKLLQDDHDKAQVEAFGNGKSKPTDSDETPAVRSEVVKVPYAVAEVKAGTEITGDLLTDPAVFGTKEIPKDLADDVVADLTPFIGQVFPNGLGKGQWVTKGLIGKAEPKAPLRDEFAAPKPGPDEVPPLPPVRKTHDVSVHTTGGTRVYRYEEVAPGEWKLIGEVSPFDRPAAKPTPKEPTPEHVD